MQSWGVDGVHLRGQSDRRGWMAAIQMYQVRRVLVSYNRKRVRGDFMLPGKVTRVTRKWSYFAVIYTIIIKPFL